jgi:acetyl esterase/lipase
MPGLGIELLRELIELQAPLRAAPLEDRRRQYDQAERAFGRDTKPGETVDAGGCHAEWVVPQDHPHQTIVVYVHGGGYCLGSTRSHRHLASAIGRAGGAAVLALDYRLAPESPFPAAVEDTVAAIGWLQARTEAAIVLAGDSAGGGLVVASMVGLRDAGHSLPAAGVCLSPWVDLTCDADSYRRLADRDPLLSCSELRAMAASYLLGTGPRHPLASPVFADLAGLPPLLIQVGTDEVLLDDARTLAGSARGAGVDVTLEEWPRMVHVWQWYLPILAEARQSLAAVGGFVEERVKPVCPRNGRTPTIRASIDRRAHEIDLSLTQQSHLLIAPWTAGHGFLSWVYQLNGDLDRRALLRALEDVTAEHEILRARFRRRDGGLRQFVEPFGGQRARCVDLSTYSKREALEVALADIERIYRSLSHLDDPGLQASVYAIDPRTSVLAMFVAEALVDSDSGTLLASELTRAYSVRARTPLPPGLPRASKLSYIDHLLDKSPDRAASKRDYDHWARQAAEAPPVPEWLNGSSAEPASTSRFVSQLTLGEWASIAQRAAAMHTSPYVLMLTCLQVALARVTGATHFLVHSIVSRRDEAAAGIIGNFHGIARIELRLDLDADLGAAVTRTGVAVAQAIDHSAVPASLASNGELLLLPSGHPLPAVRFYKFASHTGPIFAGVRRRRFRFHRAAPGPLTLSCVHVAQRHDLVFSSTVVSQARLERLARAFRGVLRELEVGPSLAGGGCAAQVPAAWG